MNAGHEQSGVAARVGLRGIAGVLPAESMSLDELDRAGLLCSPPDTLSGFGFDRAFIATREFDAGQLALRAAREALVDAKLDSKDIDLIIWASALPRNHLRKVASAPAGANPVLTNFQYAAGWLQEELGLINADVMALTQQGCATMFAALRTARAIILAEPGIRHVLCVGVDVLPEGSVREIMYNVISDAACAFVLSRDCDMDRWMGYHQLSRGYYWDPMARPAEIMAAYFPTSRATIEALLYECNLQASDVDLVVPTGVNRNSWEILLRLVNIPGHRLYRSANSFGHTISADNFLFLSEIRRQNQLPRGSRLLLFTYGFGSTWSALLLEH